MKHVLLCPDPTDTLVPGQKLVSGQKLIATELKSRVITVMRGTPGYLALEFSVVITQKVDVYSFGVDILEILCGRRDFVQSQPEERRLPSLFKKKAVEGEWLDIVDKYNLM
ncbi:G-type lectin S-receptor-like serine/threonine-protein kinase SD2-5 [Abeliophyllum distichum]|uniref:G-type lectin S-receptor-like serine/threonine-protein kinase SD2-5 n=1 Tax=Abeliophyllum distichum TaxID=126358 RepID=A0ABD1QK73_9LAMI